MVPVPSRLPVRQDLADASPYGAPVLAVPVRLNVNENPYPPPPEVVAEVTAAVTAAVEHLNRYPDRDFSSLRGALAEYLGREANAPWLTAGHMWAANGSNEVMHHVFQAFGGPGRTAVSFSPSYSMYPQYARDTHTRWATAPRRADFTLDLSAALDLIERESPSVIVLASPNNPTGTAVRLDEIASLAEATLGRGEEARAVIVVDEAYAEFRGPGKPSAVELLATYPHLAVARTMSKAFAFAGARVGYLAAAPDLVDVLRVVRLPYHLSSLTQAAALAALRHADALLAGVEALRRGRDRMVRELRGRRNPATGQALDVADSDANFVLFGRFEDRHAVWRALLGEGVLIREVGPEGWLRVSIGTCEENTAFLTALDRTLATLEVPA
ncbi:MAG: histidinol-phosphate transaminase [Bifidobacteriaceae bacterium]|nr:histidinol-phosphate transaminase [Bifidobacteriaceae bacterium]